MQFGLPVGYILVPSGRLMYIDFFVQKLTPASVDVSVFNVWRFIEFLFLADVDMDVGFTLGHAGSVCLEQHLPTVRAS